MPGLTEWTKGYMQLGKRRSGTESQSSIPARRRPLPGQKGVGAIWRSSHMPTSLAKFHGQAAAEYDAAFDWYLARSPDAALKFDAEVDRALAQIIQAPQRWAVGPLYSKVLAQTILFCDLAGTDFVKHSDGGGCAHLREAGILEAVAVATRGKSGFWTNSLGLPRVLRFEM